MNALRRRDEARPRALEARVSNPDPDDLTITIDDFDGHQLARHAWPAVAWPASPTATPARGDRCLVVLSEIGSAWVVAGEWTGPASALQWRPLELADGWSGATPDPSWARSPTGCVLLRGIVTSARPTAGEPIVRLPEDLRPAFRRSFPALIRRNLVAHVHVVADGRIEAGAIPSDADGEAVVTLDGIAYWPED